MPDFSKSRLLMDLQQQYVHMYGIPTINFAIVPARVKNTCSIRDHPCHRLSFGGVCKINKVIKSEGLPGVWGNKGTWPILKTEYLWGAREQKSF